MGERLGKNRSRRLPLTLAALSAVLTAAIVLSPLGKTLDAVLYDLFVWSFSSREAPADIVIVAIDEASFATLNLQWPWPRSTHAALIDRLFSSGARAVAFDIVFSEPSRPEEDAALAGAISRNAGRVVLGADVSITEEGKFRMVMQVRPLPLFQEAGALVGYINLPLDPDGFVRRAAPSTPGASGVEERLSFAAAALRAAGTEAPAVSAELIRFAGPARSVVTRSYYEALDPGTPDRFFRDKIVLVGSATTLHAAAVVQDQFLVPFSRFEGGQMAGVEIQANALATLARGNAVSRLPRRLEVILAIVIAALGGLMFSHIRPVPGAVVLAGAGMLIGAAVAWCYAPGSMYVSPLAVLLPLIVSYLFSPFHHYVQTWRERSFIKRAFSMYLAPSVVERLLEQPERLSPGGELVDGTVLFLDIVGFSGLAERMKPDELVRLLNSILSRLTAAVFEEDGMIDKFIGDSVMAVWGVPLPDPDHARKAAQAAIRMEQALAALRAEHAAEGRTLNVRIGIASGPMVAGNVGDRTYVNYTVVGPTVNIASRLEGLSKEYGTVTLVAASTAELLGTDLELRTLDDVVLRGREEAVRVYELCGPKGSLPAARARCLELFAEGRRCYLERRFAEAERSFAAALEQWPEDRPSRIFRERCRRLAVEPPGAEWDPVYRSA